MPFYHKSGNIPSKRHTVFKKDDGSFYYEQLFGTEGFSGMSSLLYHVQRPTEVKEILDSYDVSPKVAVEKNLKSLRLKGFDVPPENDFLESRKTLLMNSDVHLGVAASKASMTNYFYKNADADEMLFIHKGSGKLKTLLGSIPFSYGDYIIIPRGIIYQIEFSPTPALPKGKGVPPHKAGIVGGKVLSFGEDLGEANRLLYLESFSPIVTPKRYRNNFGQLLEHSPFCERDIRPPHDLETHDERGDFLVKIKKQGRIHSYIYATHPFDVVGWDGYNFPYAFSIHNFEPITGRVHQPPPVHQTFEANNYVVCSFCPRLYDYHPQAIPAPYNHSNIDSDEVLYYVAGEFMSRNDIEQGQITLHPAGIPHGPHPGAMERSIGEKETKELAVMVDTFRPLMVTEEAIKIDDGKYYKSWME